jgi:hypothetical protein
MVSWKDLCTDWMADNSLTSSRAFPMPSRRLESFALKSVSFHIFIVLFVYYLVGKFKKPLEPLEWKGLRAAKEPSAACVPDAQPSAGENFVHEEKGKKQLSQPPFSEDCLHLNVFAPHQQVLLF